MTDEQLRLAWEIFERASELPSSDQIAYVHAATVDPLIIAEVVALLEESNPPAGTSKSQSFDRTGSMFGPYRITGLLGRGGMGEVYSARDTSLNRTVALKILLTGAAGEIPAIDRYIREANAASSLNHPNIVSIFQVVQAGDDIAIAMELVEGNSFRKLCAQPSPVEHVCRFGAQAAEALAAAHQQGIIHRDIKPENLMVRPDGYVKVLDFGLAREISGDSWRASAGVPIGTLRYMSPEQIRGISLLGATDVFSLGLVLFEMATGQHAFTAKTPLETAHHIVAAAPVAPSSLNTFVPEAFDQLIARMLAKDPASRPSAAAVSESLRQIGQRLFTEPSQTSHSIEARQTARTSAAAGGRSSRLYWALVIAAATVALVWILFWFRAANDLPLEAMRFTTDPGAEGEAAISSNGSRVAYLARESEGRNAIFVQNMQGGAPVRLTSGKSSEEGPSWSPDDRRIAFLRNRLDRYADLIVMNADGGEERRIARLRTTGLGDIAWAPDGAALIVATNERPEQVMALYSIPLNGGAWKRISDPPPASEPFGDTTPAVSPDGRNLAFSRSLATGSCDIFVMPVGPRLEPAGKARRIDSAKPFNTQPAWTPDGREIVFSSGTIREGRLMRVKLDHGAKPRILQGAGESGYHPAFARRPGPAGVSLLYTRRLRLSRIYRLPIEWDAQGIPHARVAADHQLVASRSYNSHPNLSPDGTRVAFISDRTGSPQVWVVDVATGIETQWTNSDCPELAVPHWSRDGRRLTFTAQCQNQTDVFIVDGPGRDPLRLTSSPALDEISCFSPDDKWIYFTSYRDGQRIWRVSVVGGEPQPVTNQVSSNVAFSPDGQTLYFSGRFEDKESVWSMPAPGGTPKLVIPSAEYFVPVRGGVFFSTLIGVSGEQGNAKRFAYLDLVSGRIQALPEFENFDYVFTISSDRRTLIYTRKEQLATDLMKISQFR